MLRANAGAFTAIGTSACDMECADNVEHLFLERICGSLVGNTRFRVIKHTLFAGTCRADIPAGIASYAARKFALPERKAFVRCHFFERFHLIKAVIFKHLAIGAEQLIKGDVLFGFAGLKLMQDISTT